MLPGIPAEWVRGSQTAPPGVDNSPMAECFVMEILMCGLLVCYILVGVFRCCFCELWYIRVGRRFGSRAKSFVSCLWSPREALMNKPSKAIRGTCSDGSRAHSRAHTQSSRADTGLRETARAGESTAEPQQPVVNATTLIRFFKGYRNHRSHRTPPGPVFRARLLRNEEVVNTKGRVS